MSANEDVPPLEDMSEMLQQVDALRELKNQQHSTAQVNSKIQLNGHGGTHKHQTKKASKETVVGTREKKPSVIPSSNGQNISQSSGSTNNFQTITQSGDSSNNSQKGPQSSQKVSQSSQEAPQSSSSQTKQEKGSGFGGMKKGFLFGGPAKQKDSPKTASTTGNRTPEQKGSSGTASRSLEDIPFIKKQQSEENERLRFSEVQEAMEKTNTKLMENKEWVTDDLLTKLEKNERLTKRLQDPTFLQAIGEFKDNPEAALRKYSNNKEVQEFFSDFCGLMGQHFTKLGEKSPQPGTQSSVPLQPKISAVSPTGGADLSVRSSTNPNQATADDEARMQQILSDPEIQQVLMDPKIQDLMGKLRNNPDGAQRLLHGASGELKQKIDKLIRAGLLQMQTG